MPLSPGLIPTIPAVSAAGRRARFGLAAAGALAGLLAALLLACAGAGGASAPAETRPPREYAATPVGLLLNEPGAMDGYALFGSGWMETVHLIDRQGRLAYSWRFPPGSDLLKAELLENGSLLAALARDGRRFLAEMRPDGSLAWQYEQPGLRGDFVKLPNGNVLLAAMDAKLKWEVVAAGGNPELAPSNGLQFPYLLEVRPTGPTGGAVVWRWSAWDYLVQDFDPAKPNYGAPAEHPERIDLNYNLGLLPPHSNDFVDLSSLNYHPELGRIMLSAKNYGEVWVIGHRAAGEADAASNAGGGGLLYRWGNPRAYGQGAVAGQRLFHPIDGQWIAAGRPGAGQLLVFNSGNEFPGFRRYYSSVEELTLPRYPSDPGQPYPPADPGWSYAADSPTGWYARNRSGAQRLPNGNTFISDGPHGTLFQVTPQGETVWRYISPVLPYGYSGERRLPPGDPMPVRTTQETPYGPAAVWENSVWVARWYAPGYPGLQKLELTPGPPLEQSARPPSAAGEPRR